MTGLDLTSQSSFLGLLCVVHLQTLPQEPSPWCWQWYRQYPTCVHSICHFAEEQDGGPLCFNALSGRLTLLAFIMAKTHLGSGFQGWKWTLVAVYQCEWMLDLALGRPWLSPVISDHSCEQHKSRLIKYPQSRTITSRNRHCVPDGGRFWGGCTSSICIHGIITE